MRILSAWAMALLIAGLSAHAQSTQAASPENTERSYSLLRENEDWSFLKDSTRRDDFWDPIKYISLRSDDWYVTIGGEVREAFEQVDNDNWGLQPYANAFFLERYMLHSDWHFGKHYRAFVQFKSGLESFRQGGARPIDEKRLDFEAAFFEAGTSGKKNWIVLRVGRQELNYGSGRLVSIREGPNVRQSFDGFKIRSKAGPWNLDAFAVRPDLDNLGFFDNVPNHQTEFWGIYATRPWHQGVSVDMYYLGEGRKQATYDRGTATELRHSAAARLWRPTATKEPGWDFDYEGVWQFGTFGTAGIRAWTLGSDTGYALPTLPLKPRFSVKADLSSGDDPRSQSLRTFYPVFPIGNYFGVLADTGPGPVNFIDVHPRLQAQLPHEVSVSADLVAQWRENVNDGVYAVPGFLQVAAGTSRAVRRLSAGNGGPLADRSTCVSASGLWDLLRRTVSQASIPWTQHQLLGILVWIQVLRRAYESILSLWHIGRPSLDGSCLRTKRLRHNRPDDPGERAHRARCTCNSCSADHAGGASTGDRRWICSCPRNLSAFVGVGTLCVSRSRDVCVALLLARCRHACISRATHQFFKEHGNLGRSDIYRSKPAAANSHPLKGTDSIGAK